MSESFERIVGHPETDLRASAASPYTPESIPAIASAISLPGYS